MYQRTRSPENFWTLPKELLVCSVVDFCAGKERGGSKTPFWGARVSFVRFSTPPMAFSDKVCLRDFLNFLGTFGDSAPS